LLLFFFYIYITSLFQNVLIFSEYSSVAKYPYFYFYFTIEHNKNAGIPRNLNMARLFYNIIITATPSTQLTGNCA